MILLSFAHRGEASIFKKQIQGLKSFNGLGNIYVSEQEELILSITGEGVLNALSQTSFILGKFPKIEKVINLGTAGDLSGNLEKGEIVEVRTSYASTKGEMEFKSFSSENKFLKSSKYLDLISSSERALCIEEKKHLSRFGEIVDREFWGIAMAAQKVGTPFHSIKVISDTLIEQNFCEDVQAEALLYSSKLFDFYQKNITQDEEPEHTSIVDYLESLPQFRFSTAQRNLLKSKLNLKPVELHVVQKIVKENTNHKSNNIKVDTLNFLNSLTNYIDPVQAHLSAKKNKIFGQIKKQGLKINTDSSFESDLISFNFSASTSSESKEFLKVIEKFPWSDWKEFIEGSDEGN